MWMSAENDCGRYLLVLYSISTLLFFDSWASVWFRCRPADMTENIVTLSHAKGKFSFVSDQFEYWQFWSSEELCLAASKKVPSLLRGSWISFPSLHIVMFRCDGGNCSGQSATRRRQNWHSEDGSEDRDGTLWTTNDIISCSDNPEVCFTSGLPNESVAP